MASAFLTPDELVHLTGWRAPAKQRQWLQANGVRHHVNASGRPVVTWAAVEGQGRPAPEPRVLDLAAIR